MGKIHSQGSFNALRPRKIAIFQKTFSNVIFSMKLYEFWLKFHWSLFLGVQSTTFHHWFRKWLGADQVISNYLNQCRLVYWRIYMCHAASMVALIISLMCKLKYDIDVIRWNIHQQFFHKVMTSDLLGHCECVLQSYTSIAKSHSLFKYDLHNLISSFTNQPFVILPNITILISASCH